MEQKTEQSTARNMEQSTEQNTKQPAEQTTEPRTYREAYAVLQRHAQHLRDQDEPDLDELLPIVRESAVAYEFCKSRIDAVEQALKEALAGTTSAPQG